MENKHVAVVDAYFCQFGTAWKKPTELVCGFINEDDLQRLNKRCHAVGGKCSKSGKPHFHFTGIGPGGICWTRIAQPYPQSLAIALSHCLLSEARASFTTGKRSHIIRIFDHVANLRRHWLYLSTRPRMWDWLLCTLGRLWRW